MPRFFIKTENIKDEQIEILEEDVKHIKNVLRKEVGDQIEICNSENGKTYKCEIEKIEEKRILNKILQEIEEQENNAIVDIYQGIPKADKMELIIQKSVELGVNSIIPVEMKRCIAKIDSKDENKKIERWQKIAESAAKQSGRNIIPKIQRKIKLQDIINLKKEYDKIIVCYENEQNNTLKSELIQLKNTKQPKIAILIGPEGGLEESEIELLRKNEAKIVTLGKNILRTETVALNILSIIMYEFN